MYKTDPRLMEIPDETIIWRYMSFTAFYALLLNGSLFFRRLDKYTDEFEGTLPQQTRDALYDYRLKFDYTSKKEADDWTKRELLNIGSYKCHILSNSWTIGDHESYAMWKIYLQGYNEGIAVNSTVGKLKKCLEKNQEDTFYSGRVVYGPLNYKDINIYNVSTNKRESYVYEQEYRALLFYQFDLQQREDEKIRVPRYKLGKEVKMNVENLIDEIYISPFSGSWFRPIVDSVLRNFLPKFDPTKIKHSGIRDK